MASPAAALDSAAVRAIEPALLAFARRAVGDRELARDLVQETLLAGLERAQSFAGRSSLRTWLVGILSHKVIDHYRKSRPAALEIPDDDASHLELLERPSTAELELVLDQKRAVHQVALALPRLPQLERMCVLLVDVEGVARDEAQAALGVTAVHLRVLLHRGRNRLRRMLEHVALPTGA